MHHMPLDNGPQYSDCDTNTALAFFDELMMQRVDIHTLVLRTSEKISGRAGMASADGRNFSAGLQAVAGQSLVLRRELPNGHHVWLEFPASAGGNHALFLDRFGVAATVALAQLDSLSDAPAGVSIAAVLSPTVGLVDRSRMLRAIGLPHDAQVRVIAMAGPEEARATMVERLAGTAEWSRHMILGNLTALLIREPLPSISGVPIGVRVGISSRRPANEAPSAWAEARGALRFSLPSTRESGHYTDTEAVIIPWDAIGCFRILTEGLTAEQLGRDPDVQALDKLAPDGGEDIMRILESVSATDSLRKAAQHVFLHHNSVASRVEKAEAVLGFSVTEPYGRSRLLLALILRRLRESATDFP